MNSKSIISIVVLFIIYLAVLIKLLVFKYPSAMVFEMVSGNYIPFKTILNYLSGEPTWNIAIRNLGGNIILFVPLGFFVPLLRRSFAWKSVLIAALAISTVLEITQGIFRVGIFDVDDILLNVFGAILGYGIFVCIKFIFAKK